MRKSLIGAVVVALLAAGSWWGLAQLGGHSPEHGTAVTCPSASPVTVGRIVVPAGPIAGFCQPQLVMAAHIMNAARAQGIGVHTQAVGVMTAIGETGLRNLDYGDAAGPDSRGLFQQRDNGAWGSLADRMNPYTAASNFFRKLVTVDGWKTMPPTLLAHAVQVNSDANYYAQYWTEAEAIVGALNR
jgi:hypothetical protein